MEALRLLWPHTLAGLIAMAAFTQAGWVAVFWALPLIGGLPLAVPFCVLTACPAFGDWLRRAELAATPEEVARSGA